MKIIRIMKEITGAVGTLAFMFGIMSIDGFIEMGKSIIPTLVLLGAGLLFVLAFIYLQSYEEWIDAENERIRRCIDRRSRVVHVAGARKRG